MVLCRLYVDGAGGCSGDQPVMTSLLVCSHCLVWYLYATCLFCLLCLVAVGAGLLVWEIWDPDSLYEFLELEVVIQLGTGGVTVGELSWHTSPQTRSAPCYA